jgi:hypothetical protein
VSGEQNDTYGNGVHREITAELSSERSEAQASGVLSTLSRASATQELALNTCKQRIYRVSQLLSRP